MPAQVVIAHDDASLLDTLATALQGNGHNVAAFANSMDALGALEQARTVDLLITRARFPAGMPNGVALARMAKLRRPAIKVLFVARPALEPHTDGVGEFVAVSAPVAEIVARAESLLNAVADPAQ